MAIISDDLVVADSPPRPCLKLKGTMVRTIQLTGHWIRCK